MNDPKDKEIKGDTFILCDFHGDEVLLRRISDGKLLEIKLADPYAEGVMDWKWATS